MTTSQQAVPQFSEELLDSLLASYKTPEAIMGENGLIKQLTRAVVERALKAEMTEHLGYPKHGDGHAQNPEGNRRNGRYSKKLKADFGELEIEVPRDRHGSFEPQIVGKHQTRWKGLDDKILSMYARGMTVREIQGHLEEIYATTISEGFISSVTEAVMEEVSIWQNRPLDSVYPIVYMDCIHVKVRDGGVVRNKAVYLALGVNMAGEKEVLGLWISQTEGAKFWLSVVTELKNRGVQDIFIACVDGLKGFPEAIETVFPQTQVQLCIVHMVRHSLKYVSYKDQKAVASDLRTIYSSATVQEAELHLLEFEEKWGETHQSIVSSWRNNWSRIIPFFDYPPEIRKVIYTTNAIESLNMSLRKIIKNRASFPSDEALTKLLYLALQNVAKKWTMPIRDWTAALNRFNIQFEGRMPK